ncbi:MAG: hypothetical protein K8T91_01720 [Planctomycetes bacterium]|nr:hypothetical protein [Planctomycetota bacterium]
MKPFIAFRTEGAPEGTLVIVNAAQVVAVKNLKQKKVEVLLAVSRSVVDERAGTSTVAPQSYMVHESDAERVLKYFASQADTGEASIYETPGNL